MSQLSIVVGVHSDDGCKSVTSRTTFLFPDTFAHDVAHGVHSLNVEDVKIFFGVDLSDVEHNGIPTANVNISDVENPVLADAPFEGYDEVTAANIFLKAITV